MHQGINPPQKHHALFLAKFPLEKSYPLFSSNLLLKVEVLSSPLFENLVGGSTPPAETGEGGVGRAHYVTNKIYDRNTAQAIEKSEVVSDNLQP